MRISPHEYGNWGYFKVSSPNRESFAEFKGLCEIGLETPTRGDLWINGKRIHPGLDCPGEEQNLAPSDYSKFSPSCAWSHDSRYLALIKWSYDLKNGYSKSYAIYDINSKTLHSVKSKLGWGPGYFISDFQDVIKSMSRRCKRELGKILDLSPPPETNELYHVKHNPLCPKEYEPVFEKNAD